MSLLGKLSSMLVGQTFIDHKIDTFLLISILFYHFCLVRRVFIFFRCKYNTYVNDFKNWAFIFCQSFPIRNSIENCFFVKHILRQRNIDQCIASKARDKTSFSQNPIFIVTCEFFFKKVIRRPDHALICI